MTSQRMRDAAELLRQFGNGKMANELTDEADSRERMEAEIKALQKYGEDYDTERETYKTPLAVGAHDALRWALGLAEEPISEVLEKGS